MDSTSRMQTDASLLDLASQGKTRSEGRRRLPIVGFRRTLLIDPDYQLRALALPTILSVGTVTALIFTVFRLMMASTWVESGHVETVWQAPEMQWLLNSIAGALAFTVLLVLTGLIETHRSAGAIFKVQRHLKRVGEGDLCSKVFLRKGDHFQDFAEDFNRMVENLREEARMDLGLVNRALEAVGQVRPKEVDDTSRQSAMAWDLLVELKHRKEQAAR